jgi:hypothetical protein
MSCKNVPSYDVVSIPWDCPDGPGGNNLHCIGGNLGDGDVQEVNGYLIDFSGSPSGEIPMNEGGIFYDTFDTTCSMGSKENREDKGPTGCWFGEWYLCPGITAGTAGLRPTPPVCHCDEHITDHCDDYRPATPDGYVYVSSRTCPFDGTQGHLTMISPGDRVFRGCSYSYRKDWTDPLWKAPEYYGADGAVETSFTETHIPIKRMECCLQDGLASGVTLPGSNGYDDVASHDCPIDTGDWAPTSPRYTETDHEGAQEAGDGMAHAAVNTGQGSYCRDSEICNGGVHGDWQRERRTPQWWCSWDIMNGSGDGTIDEQATGSSFTLDKFNEYWALLNDEDCAAWQAVDGEPTPRRRQQALARRLSPFYVWLSGQLANRNISPLLSRAIVIADGPALVVDTSETVTLSGEEMIIVTGDDITAYYLEGYRETDDEKLIIRFASSNVRLAPVARVVLDVSDPPLSVGEIIIVTNNTNSAELAGLWEGYKENDNSQLRIHFPPDAVEDASLGMCISKDPNNQDYVRACAYASENAARCRGIQSIDAQTNLATPVCDFSMEEEGELRSDFDLPPPPADSGYHYEATTNYGKLLNLLSAKNTQRFLENIGENEEDRNDFNANMSQFCNRPDIFNFKDYDTSENRAHNNRIEEKYNHLCSCYWDKSILNTPPNRMKSIYSYIHDLSVNIDQDEASLERRAFDLVSTVDPTMNPNFKNQCWYGNCMSNIGGGAGDENKAYLSNPYKPVQCPPICSTMCYSAAIMRVGEGAELINSSINVTADNDCHLFCSQNENSIPQGLEFSSVSGLVSNAISEVGHYGDWGDPIDHTPHGRGTTPPPSSTGSASSASSTSPTTPQGDTLGWGFRTAILIVALVLGIYALWNYFQSGDEGAEGAESSPQGYFNTFLETVSKGPETFFR